MVSMTIVVLFVLFGALLIGKILMEMFPGSITTAFKEPKAEDHTPAE